MRVKLADVSDQRSDATAILQQMEVVDHKLAEIKVLQETIYVAISAVDL